MKHVKGEDKGNVVLYALSTCGWCRKTKELLKKLGVSYDFVDMDLLDYEEKKELVKDVEKCNPNITFPTLKINDECILGFKKDEIREALK
jgi:glutaredoxin